MADLKQEIRLSNWKILIVAFFNVIGYFFSLSALALADATRVIPITQTSTLLTILLGIMLLKEYQHLPQKVIAGILAITGVYLLVTL